MTGDDHEDIIEATVDMAVSALIIATLVVNVSTSDMASITETGSKLTEKISGELNMSEEAAVRPASAAYFLSPHWSIARGGEE